ncbi:MAG: DNA primase [bacterium]|nr:DNA primase [bacterium]
MDFVQQLKSSVDIVSVVREYVPRLQKRGPRWVGLCPFHTEKTPSFGVHEVHQFYKCFGCGAGGDVIKFVMELDSLTFYEALETLAERHGIPMPKRSRLSDAESRLRGSLYEIHDRAGEMFRSALQSASGRSAREYLAKRGVTGEAIEEFGIGYAEGGGQALTRRLQKDGVNQEQLNECGLVLKRHDGSGYFDRFRNRLMFPIQNERGKIIAFAGRALAADDEPKYMNSPETKIYLKKHVLYNLHRAKKQIRQSDRSVLVEGYMDVIGLHAAGVHEAVAPCGTALTNEQIRTVRRHSDKLVINFDPDAAGSNAAERSIQMLLDEAMHIRVLQLEGGLDPDEYVRTHGAEAYRACLDKAAGYFYWLADRARARFDMRTAEGRVESLKFLMPAIQRISDKLERAAVANDVAAYLGVDAGIVLEQFRRSVTQRGKASQKPLADSIPPVEQMLLTAVLKSPEARATVLPQLRELVALERFRTQGIFQMIFQLDETAPDWGYSDLEARLGDSDKTLLAASIFADQLGEQEITLEQALDCVSSLQAEQHKTKLAQLRAKVKAAERAGDMEEAFRLVEEMNRAEREAG